MALPTFLMGFTYPFLQRVVQTRWRELGWRVGLVQASNIVGAILGSFLTGTLFLTALGTPMSLRLLVLAGAAFGLMAAAAGTRRAAGGILVALVSLTLAWLIPEPQLFWARLHGSDPRELIVAEDASGVVGLQRLEGGLCVVRVNGEGQSYVPYGSVWSVLGLVPTLLHPLPIDVLVIGLGSGNTAWAAGAAPSVRRIDVYEIARPEREALAKAQRAWFGDPAVGWLLSDPRIRMTFTDGRMALRFEDKRYDVVEADALEPHMAHSGNLYSREFFELGRRRLKPGGFLCSYAPTDRTRRTFAAVFPYVLDIDVPDLAVFMIGSDEPLRLDRDALWASFMRPAVQAHIRASGDPRLTLEAMTTFFSTARIIQLDPESPRATGDVNTDLFPRDEFGH
jgi:SAM-dependent methyltransferase